MGQSLGIGWKLGLLAILIVMVGLGTWRQYTKFVGGRGFYSMVLGSNASTEVQVLVFILLPVAFVIVAFYFVLHDLK